MKLSNWKKIENVLHEKVKMCSKMCNDLSGEVNFNTLFQIFEKCLELYFI